MAPSPYDLVRFNFALIEFDQRGNELKGKTEFEGERLTFGRMQLGDKISHGDDDFAAFDSFGVRLHVRTDSVSFVHERIGFRPAPTVKI